MFYSHTVTATVGTPDWALGVTHLTELLLALCGGWIIVIGMLYRPHAAMFAVVTGAVRLCMVSTQRDVRLGRSIRRRGRLLPAVGLTTLQVARRGE